MYDDQNQSPFPSSPVDDYQPVWHSEPQVSQKILDVKSRMSKEDSGYVELLSTDISTAFCSTEDLSVLRSIEMLCEGIKSFADNNELDLREVHNLIGNYHNALAVTSKSTGEGARVAKSQWVHQKASSFQRISDERGLKKKKGLFGGLV